MRRNFQRGTVIQPGIPGLSRIDKKTRASKVSEKALQQQTRATLSNLGYAAAEVGASRKTVTCPNCAHGFFPDGWQGNTPGYPDLSVFRYNQAFPPVGVLIELKTPDGKPSKAQQDFADAGRSIITYSIADTIRAIIAAEEAMTAYQCPPQRLAELRRYLTENEGKI